MMNNYEQGSVRQPALMYTKVVMILSVSGDDFTLIYKQKNR